ncbi:MAG: DUF4956 domain-containing protein [Planctomycetota bacterium]
MLQVALQLSVAFLCGCAIACVYRLVRPRHALLPSFPATLVLLAILCALLPLVIGQNVAWAFGLVGALSIVRFRTAIEDTHDIAFVIFAVLIGMAVGANNLEVAVIGILIIGAAAFLVRPGRSKGDWSRTESKLVLRIASNPELQPADPSHRDTETLATNAIKSSVSHFELLSVTTSKQGTAMELTYRVQLSASTSPIRFIDELRNVDGVTSASLRL